MLFCVFTDFQSFILFRFGTGIRNLETFTFTESLRYPPPILPRATFSSENRNFTSIRRQTFLRRKFLAFTTTSTHTLIIMLWAFSFFFLCLFLCFSAFLSLFFSLSLSLFLSMFLYFSVSLFIYFWSISLLLSFFLWGLFLQLYFFLSNYLISNLFLFAFNNGKKLKLVLLEEIYALQRNCY